MHKTDARIMAATHRPLEQLVEQGAFREDLYYRLRVVEIVVPPLKDRLSDIPLLVDHFLQRISKRLHQPVGVITKDALQTLIRYPWPGNVRELENVLTQAVVLSRGGVIREDQIVLGGSHDEGRIRWPSMISAPPSQKGIPWRKPRRATSRRYWTDSAVTNEEPLGNWESLVPGWIG